MNRRLPIALVVPGHWPALDEAALRASTVAAVAGAIDAVLQRHGLPLDAAVELRRSDTDAAPPDAMALPELRVGPHALRAAPEQAALALAGVRGEPLKAGHLDGLRAAPAGDAAVVAAWLARLGADLVQRDIARLLTPPAVQWLAGALAERGAPVAEGEMGELAALGQDLLALRLGLHDLDAIARAWRQGREAGHAAPRIAEALLDAAGPLPVRWRANRATLRRLGSAVADHDAPRRRDAAWFDLGVRFPVWQPVPDESLPDGAFTLEVGTHASGPHFGDGPPDRLDPLTLEPCVVAEAGTLGATRSPLDWLLAHLDATLRDLAPCFVRCTDLRATLRNPAALAPELARAFLARHDVPMLARVLRALLAERVSVRNLRQIVETLCDFDTVVVDSATMIVFDERLPLVEAPPADWRPGPGMLAAFVRTGLKWQLSRALLKGGSELAVYQLEPEVERVLATRPGEADACPLSDADQRALLRGLHAAHAWTPATRDPLLLTTEGARAGLAALLAGPWPRARVAAYQELPPSVQLRPLGRIGWLR